MLKYKRRDRIKKMKNMNNWLTTWRLASLMVVVVVLFISMAEPVASQSSNRNSTLIRYYCSLYRGRSEEYFYSNLNTTLSSLRRQLLVNDLHYAVARTLINEEPVWGLASCRDYVSNADCVACYDYAVAQLKVCGSVDGAEALYNDCGVRYDNYNFSANAEMRAGVVICGNETSPQASDLRKTTKKLLSDLRTAVPRTSNYFAASTRRLSNSNGTVYALAQCDLNLTQSVCKDCLNFRYSSLLDCLPGTTGRAVDNGCFMRYSRTPFYRQNQTTDITNLLRDGHSSTLTIITGALGGVCLFFLIALTLLYSLRRKSKKTKEGDSFDISEMKQGVNYSYKHLQLPTDNFSEKNIIGKGGFGVVFKATLDNNEIAAVKKLEVRYLGAKVDFQNEILLIRDIKHVNLLRLLGWSSEGSNLLLVLEYMPNGSLDRYLWGAKRGVLNWKQRYDIILGIARGLAHLHAEFHVKIIHRDIKSSNILLDDDFQPKIADFGLARFQPEDQSHVITKFSGTLGYTAPEYARYGILSDKVDTYSFGIVTLEIVSGRRCTNRNFDGPSTDHLLEHAWKMYESKRHLKLVDETMDLNQYEDEQVVKIVEIALLCTQSPVSKRPKMSEVVLMLPNGQPSGELKLTRPTLIYHDRRVRTGPSNNSS